MLSPPHKYLHFVTVYKPAASIATLWRKISITGLLENAARALLNVAIITLYSNDYRYYHLYSTMWTSISSISSELIFPNWGQAATERQLLSGFIATCRVSMLLLVVYQTGRESGSIVIGNEYWQVPTTQCKGHWSNTLCHCLARQTMHACTIQ